MEKDKKKSTESPWLTEGLRKQIKKILAIFKHEGRSFRWKCLDTSIKKTLETRKTKFFDNESDRLKTMEYKRLRTQYRHENSSKQPSYTFY